MFSTWPRLAQQCGRPTPTKLIFLDIPAFPPQHKSPDCRTLPRVRYFNDRLNAMARENGWEVVDVYKLAKPVAVDMTLTDGIHCASLLLLLSGSTRPGALTIAASPRRHAHRRDGCRRRRAHRPPRDLCRLCLKYQFGSLAWRELVE